MRSGVLGLVLVFFCIASAPPVHAAGACSLVCLGPDERLDADKCACVKQGDAPLKACALVCPDGQALDAANCACVKKN